MKKIIIGLWLCIVGVGIFAFSPVYAVSEGDNCDPKVDIMLNLEIPFVGRCIKKSTGAGSAQDGSSTYTEVFPNMVGGLSRIVMAAIIIFGFLGILLGGFMIASDGAFGTKAQGLKIITTIITGLIVLGASGVILNLVNPTFFGTGS